MKSPFFKITLILCLLFISIKGYACHCALKGEFTIKEVDNFDYVALVKINNTSPMDTTGGISHERPWFFTAEIQELQVFKGSSVTSLKIIQGKRKFGYFTSCDQGIDTGEEWLIFGNLNNDQIEVNSCTPTSQFKIAGGGMDWQYDRTLKKIKILESLLEE